MLVTQNATPLGCFTFCSIDTTVPGEMGFTAFSIMVAPPCLLDEQQSEMTALQRGFVILILSVLDIFQHV